MKTKKGKSRAVVTPEPAPTHTFQDLQHLEEDPPRFTVGEMATQVLALAYLSEEGTSLSFVIHYRTDKTIERPADRIADGLHYVPFDGDRR